MNSNIAGKMVLLHVLELRTELWLPGPEPPKQIRNGEAEGNFIDFCLITCD